MAALCHDVGHLPFSHASEDLVPNGYDHEEITRRIIRSEEMREIWDSITPPLRYEDIEKLAVGPKKASDMNFSDWEAILSEIIVGDAFGVDRMDYLLRDSYHAGVAYGRFDHYRLVDTLRILSSSQTDRSEESREPALGVKVGGIQSAEAMMLARYLMYSQVYFHPVRRIYDIHLTDFLRDWLEDGVFSIDVDNKSSTHLKETLPMGRMRNAALITRLVEQLRGHDSWCGETHVQKTTYFLQSLMHVPLGFDFILYKHGPFSFELRDELTALRADGLLTLEHDNRYSPRILTTEKSKKIQRRFPNMLAKYENSISFVAQKLGPKGVVQLERLGTALYVRLQGDVVSDEQVRQIRNLKPHIAASDARRAVKEVGRIVFASSQS